MEGKDGKRMEVRAETTANYKRNRSGRDIGGKRWEMERKANENRALKMSEGAE